MEGRPTFRTIKEVCPFHQSSKQSSDCGQLRNFGPVSVVCPVSPFALLVLWTAVVYSCPVLVNSPHSQPRALRHTSVQYRYTRFYRHLSPPGVMRLNASDRRWVLTAPRRPRPPARHRPPPRRCAHGPSQHRASWARALPRAAASAPPPTRPGRGLSPPSLPLTSPSLNFDPSPGLKEKGQYRSIKLERSNDYVTAAATCSWSRGRRAFIAVAVP